MIKISNSIFLPNNMQPYQQSIDMGNDNTFSCQINGNVIDSYSVVIKSLDNVVRYSSGKITLGTKLFNLQMLNMSISGGVITFKGQLKWILTYFNGIESVSSGEMIFTNMSTPVLTSEIGTTITTKEYTFNPVYTQAENIPIKKYNYNLYLVNYSVNCGGLKSQVSDQVINCGSFLDNPTAHGLKINCSNF